MRIRHVLLTSAALLASAAPALARTDAPPAEPAPVATTADEAVDDGPEDQTGEPEASAEDEPSGDATTVEGVTVRSDPNSIRTAIDRRSYNVANDLQAVSGSVADALRNVPSVQVDVQGEVTLRGGGVTILVDGKPSAMFSGEGRADALQQMPADQIERIEVMTNPSAEFSPEGTGGIINLVTKQTRRQVRMATVRANVGTDGRYNGGLSGSLMSGPLTLSGNIGIRHDINEVNTDTERSRYDSGSGDFLDDTTSSRSRGVFDSSVLRGNLDYDLNAVNRLSAEFRYYGADGSSRAATALESDGPGGVLVQAFERDSRAEFSNENIGGALRWRRQFAGEDHNLVLDLSGDRSENERETRVAQTWTLPVQPALYEVYGGASERRQLRLKLDYNRPIGDEQRLKLGAEYEVTNNLFDNWGERGPAPDLTVPDPMLTNRFEYEQSIQTVYATYQRPIGPVTAQFGLRLEAVQIDINQLTLGIRADNDYTGFYPSLHLAYDLTDKQRLTGSYSRRIQRPWANDLNPFVVYIDPFNRRSGNPDLEPEITNSYELGWEYRQGRNTFLASLYVRDTFDGVTDVKRDLGGGVILTTRENLTQQRNGGLELTANGRLAPTLTYNFSTNIFHAQLDGGPLGRDRSGTMVSGWGALNWQATPNDFIQLSGWVFSGQMTLEGDSGGGGGLNMGWRHKFNDDISLVFTAQDLLDSIKWDQRTRTPLLRERTQGQFNGRTFYVGLTWNFGSGGRRPPEQGFDFGSGGQGGGAPTGG